MKISLFGTAAGALTTSRGAFWLCPVVEHDLPIDGGPAVEKRLLSTDGVPDGYAVLGDAGIVAYVAEDHGQWFALPVFDACLQFHGGSFGHGSALEALDSMWTPKVVIHRTVEVAA